MAARQRTGLPRRLDQDDGPSGPVDRVLLRAVRQVGWQWLLNADPDDPDDWQRWHTAWRQALTEHGQRPR